MRNYRYDLVLNSITEHFGLTLNNGEFLSAPHNFFKTLINNFGFPSTCMLVFSWNPAKRIIWALIIIFYNLTGRFLYFADNLSFFWNNGRKLATKSLY